MNEENKKTNPSQPLDEKKVAQAKEEYREAIKKKVLAGLDLTPEEEQAALEMLSEAEMPVEFKDNDFKLGPQEIDIRKLSTRNFRQMMFRVSITQGVWLRNMTKSLIDITSILFVLLDKMGVENIVGESDRVLLKIHKQELENQKKAFEQKAAATAPEEPKEEKTDNKAN